MKYCYEIYKQGVRNQYLTTVDSLSTAKADVKTLNTDFLKHRIHKDFDPKKIKYDFKDKICYYPSKQGFDEIAPFHFRKRSYNLDIGKMESIAKKDDCL